MGLVAMRRPHKNSQRANMQAKRNICAPEMFIIVANLAKKWCVAKFLFCKRGLKCLTLWPI